MVGRAGDGQLELDVFLRTLFKWWFRGIEMDFPDDCGPSGRDPEHWEEQCDCFTSTPQRASMTECPAPQRQPVSLPGIHDWVSGVSKTTIEPAAMVTLSVYFVAFFLVCQCMTALVTIGCLACANDSIKTVDSHELPHALDHG
jgi:hypothetical protein